MVESIPRLVMQDINKRFSGFPALIDASLEVEAGEVHALIGQNGAGKSTLIKVLTGAYSCDEGLILLDGIPISCSSTREAQDLGISPIYQEISLIPYRSVAENVFLGREPKRFGFIDWPHMNNAAAELLARFGVFVDVKLPLNTYTIAVQQMVAIARALSCSAKLVIMDEPTSSLAEHEVGILFDAIGQLKKTGTSVLFVSHRLDELYAVCDNVTIMRDGRTVARSAMVDISRIELVTTMLGRPLDVAAHKQRIRSSDHASDTVPLLNAVHLARGTRVRDINLEIRPGEVIGLSGLLGSGRSETARVLFGADQPENGTIAIDGKSIAFKSPADAIACGIGFCSEDRKSEGIIPYMSVRENLTIALLPRLAHLGIIDTKKQYEVVDLFIKRLGIKTANPNQPIRDLSGGNQQKVLLARWLCMNPRLLILDEPTRGIDVGAKAEIQSLVKEFAERGLGVMMISSEIEELLEACDQVVVLRDGRNVVTLNQSEMSEPAIMQAMAQGRAAGMTGAD